MLFTSLEFLFLFFPIVFGIYFLLPNQFRNYWLLIASLFFYAWGEPRFLIIMVLSIALNYIFAIRIEDAGKKTKTAKLFLALSIIMNIGILFVYKYLNFVTLTLHDIFPSTKHLFDVTKFVLPIGISFFTFQGMSYVIDVYRGIPAQRNIFNLGLYISLFPQLIAGPIVRYTTVADQIMERHVTSDMFCKGALRFVVGFNKKVLLSNILAQVADIAFGADELSFVLAWVGAICYTLQIYFDFSGYSDMAIGLGLMFGFEFLENFNFPYISKTITEFWRRWHISLGSWFRDYVYFPLGGSRVKSKLRLVFNLAVVWIITGIWHGASWNFILWGALYGVIIIVEKLFSLPDRLSRRKVPAVLYQIFTMLMVIFGWVLFRAVNISSAGRYLSAMLGFGSSQFIDAKTLHYILSFGIIIIAGIIASVPLTKFIKERISAKYSLGGAICDTVTYVIQLVLFVTSVSFLVMNAHNPFIYFNF